MEEETKAFLSCASSLNFASLKSTKEDAGSLHETSSTPSRVASRTPVIYHGVDDSSQQPMLHLFSLHDDAGKTTESPTPPSQPYIFTTAPKTGFFKTRKNKIKARVVPTKINETLMNEAVLNNLCPH